CRSTPERKTTREPRSRQSTKASSYLLHSMTTKRSSSARGTIKTKPQVIDIAARLRMKFCHDVECGAFGGPGCDILSQLVSRPLKSLQVFIHRFRGFQFPGNVCLRHMRDDCVELSNAFG